MPLNNIVLPIRLRLSDLKRTKGPIDSTLLEMVCPKESKKSASTKDGGKHSQQFRDFVSRKLGSAESVLLLDGWDEVTKDRDELRERLAEFSDRRRQQPILLASRIVGYSASPIPGAQELVMQLFAPSDVEAFARGWFRDSSNDRTATFLSTLRSGYSIRELARIPLMLALICRAYQSGKKVPQRRGELYRVCLWGLLRDWKQTKSKGSEKPASNIKVRATLCRLQMAAEKLLWKDMEQFRDEQFAEAAGWDWEEQPEKAQKFVDDLKDDGLLTATNEEQTEFIFLHRTFQEYLAACSLAARPWKELEPLICRLSWSPNWREAIVLMAGEMGDSAVRGEPAERLTRLLDLFLDADTDTVDRHRLALAVLCLAEVPEPVRCEESEAKPRQRISTVTVRRIVAGAHAIQMRHLSEFTLAALPHYEGCWRAVAGVDQCLREVIPGLVRSVRNGKEGDVARSRSAEALGMMGAEAARHPGVIPSLIDAAQDGDHRHLRNESMKALGAMGVEAARHPEVIPVLLAKPSWETTLALIAMGSDAAGHPLVIPTMLRALVENKKEHLFDPAMVLMRMGVEAAKHPAVIPCLLSALERSEDPWVRVYSVDVLGNMGTEALTNQGVVPALVMALHNDKDPLVRHRAASALGSSWRDWLIPMPEVVSDLVRSVHEDQDQTVRVHSASALGAMARIGVDAARDSAVIPVLLRCLRGRQDYWLRRMAAVALGNMGAEGARHPEVIPTLLHILLRTGRDSWLRHSAAEALGAMGLEAIRHPDVIPSLIRSLHAGFRARLGSAKALGQMGIDAARHPEVIPALLSSLREDRSYMGWVRESSAEALGRMGVEAARHPNVIPALLRSMHEEDYPVSAASAQALGAIERTGARVFSGPAKAGQEQQWLIRWVDDLVSEGFAA